jgi:hypothetical protein
VIRQLFARVYTPDEYLVARLHEALAHDQRTGELGITASCSGAAAVLSGIVPTPQRREAVLAVVREVLDGRLLRDEIAAAELSKPRRMEQLGDQTGMPAPGEVP